MQTELFGSTACASIYQSPQSAYDLFDKVCVLYEGRQIFFGRTGDAKQYFVSMGYCCLLCVFLFVFLIFLLLFLVFFFCEGFEGKVTRTPDEFAMVWCVFF